MSRMMKTNATEAFRTVVTFAWGEAVFGPYATLGAARSAATRHAGPAYSRMEWLPFRIQRTSSAWVDVEPASPTAMHDVEAVAA